MTPSWATEPVMRMRQVTFCGVQKKSDKKDRFCQLNLPETLISGQKMIAQAIIDNFVLQNRTKSANNANSAFSENTYGNHPRNDEFNQKLC